MAFKKGDLIRVVKGPNPEDSRYKGWSDSTESIANPKPDSYTYVFTALHQMGCILEVSHDQTPKSNIVDLKIEKDLIPNCTWNHIGLREWDLELVYEV